MSVTCTFCDSITTKKIKQIVKPRVNSSCHAVKNDIIQQKRHMQSQLDVADLGSHARCRLYFAPRRSQDALDALTDALVPQHN